MQLEPLQIIAGGIVGFASAGSLRWWQYQRDLWIGEVERFCDTLIEAADCATEYWLTQKSDIGEWNDGTAEAGKEERNLYREISIREAKIQGLQGRLDGLLACFVERLSVADRDELFKRMGDFADALTGGHFGGAQRDIDTDRAQLAQVYSAELLISMRLSISRAMTVQGLLGWSWQRLILYHIDRWKR